MGFPGLSLPVASLPLGSLDPHSYSHAVNSGFLIHKGFTFYKHHKQNWLTALAPDMLTGFSTPRQKFWFRKNHFLLPPGRSSKPCPG